MELAGLEPATSWVRSRRAPALVWLVFRDFLEFRHPASVRDLPQLQEIAGVPSRGRPGVIKPWGLARYLSRPSSLSLGSG